MLIQEIVFTCFLVFMWTSIVIFSLEMFDLLSKARLDNFAGLFTEIVDLHSAPAFLSFPTTVCTVRYFTNFSLKS